MSGDLTPPPGLEGLGERPLLRHFSLIVARDETSWHERGLRVWLHTVPRGLLLDLAGSARFGDISLDVNGVFQISMMTVGQYRLARMRGDRVGSSALPPRKGGVQMINGVRWESLWVDNQFVLEDRIFKTVEWVLRGQEPHRKKGR